MAGITSFGAYIPMYRLDREEIGRMWGMRVAGGEKAVAGYDEDTVTMAVDAARDSLRRHGTKPDGLYLATTTAPYKEKQHAAIIGAVLDLGRRALTVDINNSLRSGTTALMTALDAVKAGSATELMVVASDCRMGAPRGRFEQLVGDGAAALTVGCHDPIAEVDEGFSLHSDFTDVWRKEGEHFLRAGEGRFIEEVGYMPIMQEAISELMKAGGLTPKDFARIVFYAHDPKQHADLARKLGFEAWQVQDPLFAKIGNTGTAAVLLMLVAALEEAQPGHRILVAGYGDGVDCFILRVTDNIAKINHAPLMQERINRKRNIDYATYLSWRDLIPFEASSLPERAEPSLASRWRERKTIASLSGVKCRKCGTPQIHPIGQNVRICVACQARDEFDPYTFADKRGTLFTYAVDQLQPTKNPPGLNGVIDFEDGGRFVCELTDYDLSTVKIGMPVEMTFRKLSAGKGIVNYFWKAKPLAE